MLKITKENIVCFSVQTPIRASIFCVIYIYRNVNRGLVKHYFVTIFCILNVSGRTYMSILDNYYSANVLAQELCYKMHNIFVMSVFF